MREKRQRDVYVKPIEKIEVESKHITLRIVLLVVFLGLAIFFFGLFLKNLLNPKESWTLVESDSSYPNSSSYVDLYYDYSNVDLATKKDIKNFYTELSVLSYRLFDEKESYEGYKNINYLNEHPNEIVEVDSGLYKALEIATESNARYIYLEPMYLYIEAAANSNSDMEAREYDYRFNADVSDYYDSLYPYVSSSDKINLELLGNDKVKLKVSDDYLNFAQDEGIDLFIGLTVLKTTFILDYIADRLIDKRYTDFYIKNDDGSFRLLKNEEVIAPLSTFVDKEVSLVGTLKIDNRLSFVGLKSYPLTSKSYPYYIYENKEILSGYIDLNGHNNFAIDALYSYSNNLKCSELMMKSLNFFINDHFDYNTVLTNEFMTLYTKDSILYYTDDDIVVELNDGFSKEKLNG